MFVRPRKKEGWGERERGTEGKEELLVCSPGQFERRQLYPSLGAALSKSVLGYTAWSGATGDLKVSLLVPHLVLLWQGRTWKESLGVSPDSHLCIHAAG